MEKSNVKIKYEGVAARYNVSARSVENILTILKKYSKLFVLRYFYLTVLEYCWELQKLQEMFCC